ADRFLVAALQGVDQPPACFGESFQLPAIRRFAILTGPVFVFRLDVTAGKDFGQGGVELFRKRFRIGKVGRRRGAFVVFVFRLKTVLGLGEELGGDQAGGRLQRRRQP